MTVRELIVTLSTFDPELQVGTPDDMGDIEEIYNVGLHHQPPMYVAIRTTEGWKLSEHE